MWVMRRMRCQSTSLRVPPQLLKAPTCLVTSSEKAALSVSGAARALAARTPMPPMVIMLRSRWRGRLRRTKPLMNRACASAGLPLFLPRPSPCLPRRPPSNCAMPCASCHSHVCPPVLTRVRPSCNVLGAHVMLRRATIHHLSPLHSIPLPRSQRPHLRFGARVLSRRLASKHTCSLAAAHAWTSVMPSAPWHQRTR